MQILTIKNGRTTLDFANTGAHVRKEIKSGEQKSEPQF